MNSPTQPNRQYHHNTCELSIEDKKSPFPAWMKFNKPNPLKFNLSLQDPDRPEQPPISISGDRVKLDTLHQTVGEYVGNLLTKSPLPLSATPDIEIEPIASPDASANLERPIDALKMTGDRPHLEADGPSRHLLYLGNMADDGQVMASLSTLQLFDLSSTLDEAAQPLAATSAEDSSSALGSVGTEIEPEVISPSEIADTPATAAAAAAIFPPAPAGSMVVQKFETDVEEPRVVLPSVQETVNSDNLESESSFFERNSTVDNNDRFKMPKPSLGSLNLPELPDFSNSPLTSIWLWLGLGTVATGIVAFPFLNKSVTELTSKPTATTQSTPGASAESSDLAGIPSYQPSPATTPSGLNNGLPSSLSSPSASPSVTISPSAGQVTITPTQSGSGTTIGSNGNTNIGGLVNSNIGTPRTGTGTNARATTGTNTGANPRSQVNGQTPTDSRMSTASRFGSGTTGNPTNNGNSRTTRRDNSSPIRNSAPTPNTGGTVYEPSGLSEFEAKTTPQDPTIASNRGTTSSSRARASASARVAAPAPSASTQTDLVGQGQDLTGESGSSINNPVSNIPADNSPILSSPNGSRLGDSAQVDSTRQYFQNRWPADPNFSGSLQYNLRVGKDGKVISIDGQTADSRQYLRRTNFITPGTQITSSGSQDQNIIVILKPNGTVEALGN